MLALAKTPDDSGLCASWARSTAVLRFGDWLLGFPWDLVIGHWTFFNCVHIQDTAQAMPGRLGHQPASNTPFSRKTAIQDGMAQILHIERESRFGTV